MNFEDSFTIGMKYVGSFILHKQLRVHFFEDITQLLFEL
jgi:hypothetical protein